MVDEGCHTHEGDARKLIKIVAKWKYPFLQVQNIFDQLRYRLMWPWSLREASRVPRSEPRQDWPEAPYWCCNFIRKFKSSQHLNQVFKKKKNDFEFTSDYRCGLSNWQLTIYVLVPCIFHCLPFVISPSGRAFSDSVTDEEMCLWLTTMELRLKDDR